MKKIVAAGLFFLIAALGVNAQGSKGSDEGPMKKIEELEKIKLIETLGMDEQTTLKFFSRRTKYREEQTELVKNSSGMLDQISEFTKKDDKKNDEELKKILNF